jgi:hypothetical protein
MLQSLEGLLHLAERPIQGPSPTYDRAHLLLAFMTIGESRIIGRQVLANRSGLGEGAVRTVLKKLREAGYAEAKASGCYLTAVGRRAYDSILASFSPLIPIKESKLTVGEFQVGLAVRGRGRAVQSGIEQRDSAIRANAAGATTFVFKGGRFAIPGGSSDCEKDFPGKAWSRLRESLKLKEGDIVILCGAGDETTAKLGALSAALTLL